jgi:predicted esterase YcpF (UPF0227 family)
MTRATLVYLHGFNSSPGTVKGRKVATASAALREPPVVHIPVLHHRPAVAMADVCAWVEAHVADRALLTFIGSSLGGFYATWLAERYGTRAVLINPAIDPSRSLAVYLGPQANMHTGERYELTSAHFAELEALHVSRVTRPERYFLLMRSGDELLDWREAVEHYAGAWQYVAGGGNHGWEDIDGEIPSIFRFAGVAPVATLATSTEEKTIET